MLIFGEHNMFLPLACFYLEKFNRYQKRTVCGYRDGLNDHYAQK